MTDLPEELMREARDVWMGECGIVEIARALMAARKDERERAARIARNTVSQADSESVAARCFNIAAAILGEQSHAE